jgi:cyclophilin family peptidyl-prolyl cis-trans isomerase
MSTNVLKWVVILFTVIVIGGGIVYMESTTRKNVPLGVGQSDVIKEVTPLASESATPSQTATQSAQTDVQKENPSPTTKSMKPKSYATQPVMSLDVAKTYTATMTTTDGIMKIKLNASEVPVTVNNFVFLAREGFYTNTVFHRILSGFMIQGGDPTGTGMGSPGYKFNDEPVTREYTRGTIAMANAGANTNGSQFFIMHADYPLPKNYIIFGAIDPSDPESLKTLDKLAATPVTVNEQGEKSKPVTPPAITSVTIEEK